MLGRVASPETVQRPGALFGLLAGTTITAARMRFRGVLMITRWRSQS